MREFDLRSLQLKELECLKEIDRICRKYDLEYYLAWGSAIGAMRHKGFIPWDDDIDVLMKWEDYVKFKECFLKEANPDFFYQDWHSDRYYYSSWAKLRMNNTTEMMRELVGYPMHGGVNIDIFPLLPYGGDHLSKFDRFLAKLVMFSANKRLNDYGHGEISYENKKLRYVPAFLCDWVKNIAYSLLVRPRKNITHYATNGCHTFDLFFPKEWFSGVNEVEFEGEMFYVNNGVDDYLRAYYGDYMQIPKVEDRLDHGDLIVDLENDYKMYQKIGEL